jgi:hypothetical protein
MSSRNNFALWSSIVRRAAVLIASAAINAFTIPAVAAECTSIKDIDASRSRWEMVRSQAAKAAVKENTCRAYATLFYESVTLRQVATTCIAPPRRRSRRREHSFLLRFHLKRPYKFLFRTI